jgi:hypothetical protein
MTQPSISVGSCHSGNAVAAGAASGSAHVLRTTVLAGSRRDRSWRQDKDCPGSRNKDRAGAGLGRLSTDVPAAALI